MKKRKALSRWQRWAKKNPDKAKRHNERRRKRTDRRNKTIWHTRLRLLMLHTGEFHTRLRDRYYQGIDVLLTPYELAVVWFRDKAWMMQRPHLDRINPDGDYEFGNVRFIEDFENYARRRTNGTPPRLKKRRSNRRNEK